MEHKSRTILGILAVLMVVLFSWGYTSVLQSQGAGINSNSGLNGNVTLASMYHTTEIWNGTAWIVPTVTLNGQSATIPVLKGENYMIVATQNKSLNVEHLLENGEFYNYVNVLVSGGTGKNVSLKAVYMVLGTLHNSTSTNAFGDKAVYSVTDNVTFYSNNTNNLGTAQPFNIFNSFSGLGNYVFYVIQFSASGTGSIELQSHFSYPFDMNIVSDYTYVAILAMLLAIVLAIISFPRLNGAAEYKLKKNEVSGGIAFGFVAVIIYLITYFGGSSIPFSSESLSYVALLGLATGIYLYGMQESKGSGMMMVLAGLVAMTLFIIASIFFPFLGPLAAVESYSFAGEVAAIMEVLFAIILAAGGVAALKHNTFDAHPGIF